MFLLITWYVGDQSTALRALVAVNCAVHLLSQHEVRHVFRRQLGSMLILSSHQHSFEKNRGLELVSLGIRSGSQCFIVTSGIAQLLASSTSLAWPSTTFVDITTRIVP